MWKIILKHFSLYITSVFLGVFVFWVLMLVIRSNLFSYSHDVDAVAFE